MNRATFQFAGVINRGGSRKFPTCPWKFFSTEIKILLFSLFSRNRQTERQRERELIRRNSFLSYPRSYLPTEETSSLRNSPRGKTKVSDSGFQLVLCAHVENEPCFPSHAKTGERKRERERGVDILRDGSIIILTRRNVLYSASVRDLLVRNIFTARGRSLSRGSRLDRVSD